MQAKVIGVEHAFSRRIDAAWHGDSNCSGRLAKLCLLAEHARHLRNRFRKRPRIRLLFKAPRDALYNREGFVHNACGDVCSANIEADSIHDPFPFSGLLSPHRIACFPIELL